MESIIELPLELVTKSPGFSIDVGATLAKVIYRSKEDYTNGVPTHKVENGFGRVHLVSLPNTDIDGIIKLVQEKCDFVRATEGETKVTTTGVGSNKHLAKICKELNVRLTVASEFDCAVHALVYMTKQMTSEQLFLPKPRDGLEFGEQMGHMIHNLAEGIHKTTKGTFHGKRDTMRSMEEVAAILNQDADKPQFPILLVVAGSNFGWALVQEDGSCQLVNFSNCSGSFFLNVVFKATGVKDFDTIAEWLEKCKGDSCDVCPKDIVKPGEDDIYSTMPMDFAIMPFGKAWEAPREAIVDGDIAGSLAGVLARDIAQLSQYQAIIYKAKRIVFSGNFANIPVVMKHITATLHTGYLATTTEPIKYDFIKNGGYLGCLGSFMM